jgi:hypothetical protein
VSSELSVCHSSQTAWPSTCKQWALTQLLAAHTSESATSTACANTVIVMIAATLTNNSSILEQVLRTSVQSLVVESEDFSVLII